MPFSFKPTQTGESPQTDVSNTAPVLATPPTATGQDQNTITPPTQFATHSNVPLGSMPLNERIDDSKKISLFQIFIYAILAVCVIVTAGLFGYQNYLNSKIESQKKILDEKDKTLGVINLVEMKALSNRMKVVNQVLSEHASVRSAFLILEKSIEDPVTYKSFDLKKSTTGNSYDLKVGAVASSYKAVAQQLDTLNSDEFNKKFISNVKYDGVSLDSVGKVNFSISMNVFISGKLPESLFIDSKKINNTEDTSSQGTSTIEVASSTSKVSTSTIPK